MSRGHVVITGIENLCDDIELVDQRESLDFGSHSFLVIEYTDSESVIYFLPWIRCSMYRSPSLHCFVGASSLIRC